MEYIKLHIKYTDVNDRERRKAIIRNLESSTDRVTVNEMPIILNVLSHSTDIKMNNDRFDYKLPFKLA